MKTPVKKLDQPGRYGPRQIVMSSNGFKVEICRHPESYKTAFHLRYQAYRQVGSIPPNAQELLFDDYDQTPYCWTHLVWYNGQAIATIRSCVYSEAYEWQSTEARKYFKEDIDNSIGENVSFLESNRFAVDPKFQGRKSMFAQLLLFQMHALNSAVHQIDTIITAVREHHVRFYEKFLGMEEVAAKRQHVDWANAMVALMATQRQNCLEVALQKGMPNFTEEDLQRYRAYAGINV